MSTPAVLEDHAPPSSIHIQHRPGIDLGKITCYLKLQLGALGDKRLMRPDNIDVGEADRKMFRLSKKILASRELKKIRHHDGAIRTYIRGICLPFEPGVHFLPLRAVTMVNTQLKEFRQKRQDLVNQFLDAYPVLREDARRRLKTFFNERDYPPVEIVAEKFYMDWDYLAFSTPDEIHSVAPEIFEEQREKAARQLSDAVRDIQYGLRVGLCKLVESLRDDLAPGPSGGRKRLYDSAVTKVTEFLAHFDLRNVTDDRELKQVVDQLRGLLRPVSMEELRTTDTVRQRIQQSLSDAANRLGSMVQEEPIRGIRFAA